MTVTDEMVELKPCPFCGGAPVDRAIEAHTHSAPIKALGIPDHPGSHVVECSCGAGLIDDTREEVVTRWNRRAASPEGGETWRPIETAPKDETDVLLYFPLTELPQYWDRIIIARFHDGHWVWQGRAVRGYSDAYQPTHWQPLPDPPAELASIKEKQT